MRERAITIAVAIVGRAITVDSEMEERSKETILKKIHREE